MKLLPLALSAALASPAFAEPASQPAAPPSAAAAPGSVAPASIASVSAPASTPDLPMLVRTLLGNRMLRHGKDLGALENSVKALDFKAVHTHATAIADEPQLARPMPDSDAINASIPPAFFTLQEVLHSRAHALAAAAKDKNAVEVQRAYEVLGETCGQCHEVWFPMPGDGE